MDLKRRLSVNPNITNNPQLVINSKLIDKHSPTYFIADIAANHDGSLEKAKELIYLAAESGADAAKFQHFQAKTIVSDYEFRRTANINSHQSKWTKSVFDVYSDASLSLEWTPILRQTCDDAGINFMTSPYSHSLADHADPFLDAYKIGSGDITWIDLIKHIAQKGKPILIASGASTMADVERAVSETLTINQNLCLMQCNTNYTGSLENFKNINLNVIRTFQNLFPNVLIGLSDHTPGHATVLGAVTLGARVIEKHLTKDNAQVGPDHAFSMTPRTWREMVDRTRELEAALGDGIKVIEKNELETAIVQRRSICAKEMIPAGTIITEEMLIPLRPCPADAFPPYKMPDLIGRETISAIQPGESLTSKNIR